MSEKKFSKADIFKFIGLVVFLLLMVFVVYLIWPYIAEMFQPGGVEKVLDQVRNAGPAGVFILLGMQFLQIVVAFIPGEITQIAAGLLYGPWFGALIILVGCVISSAFVYQLVHRLGAPFVQSIVPTKHLSKFREFEAKGRLNILVFILFLIPGLPKDTFTYLVPLTDMKMREFLLLSNVARIPGIVVSTYAANGFAEGHIVSSIVIFVIAAVIAILGLVFREKIIDSVGPLTKRFSKKASAEKDDHEVDVVEVSVKDINETVSAETKAEDDGAEVEAGEAK